MLQLQRAPPKMRSSRGLSGSRCCHLQLQVSQSLLSLHVHHHSALLLAASAMAAEAMCPLPPQLPTHCLWRRRLGYQSE